MNLSYLELLEALNTIIDENSVIKLSGLLKVLSENPNKTIIVNSNEKIKGLDPNLVNFKPKHIKG